MQKLNVAIIGYGRSGRNIHTDLLKQLPDLFEIVAYVDADNERREMIKREMNKPVYPEYSALFDRKDIDLVVNASFNKDHAPISKDLLKHGFNVLSEKPVSANAEEFQTVLDTVKQTGKKYYAFQQYRFSPGFAKIREIISSGVLGRIVSIDIKMDNFSRRWDWQTVHDNSAGVLLNNGPHYMDWALCLMGYPANVQTFAYFDHANYAGNGEDYVKLILRAPGAPMADIELSSCNTYPSQLLLVQGTQGSLKGNETSLNWKYFEPANEKPIKLDLRPLRNENGEPIYCREKLNFIEKSWTPELGDKSPGEYDHTERGLAYYRALHANFTTGAEFPIKPEQLLLQMKVVSSAHEQNRELFK